MTCPNLRRNHDHVNCNRRGENGYQIDCYSVFQRPTWIDIFSPNLVNVVNLKYKPHAENNKSNYDIYGVLPEEDSIRGLYSLGCPVRATGIYFNLNYNDLKNFFLLSL